MNEGIYDVSVSELFRAVLKKWWIVVIAFLVGALLAFAYTEYLVVPTYKTTAKLHTLRWKSFLFFKTCDNVIKYNLHIYSSVYRL